MAWSSVRPPCDASALEVLGHSRGPCGVEPAYGSVGVPVLDVYGPDEHDSHAVRPGIAYCVRIRIPRASWMKRPQELRTASATNVLRCLFAVILRHTSFRDKDRFDLQAALVRLADAAVDFAVPAVSVTSLRDAGSAAFEIDRAMVLAGASDVGMDQGLPHRICGTATGDVLEDFVKASSCRCSSGIALPARRLLCRRTRKLKAPTKSGSLAKNREFHVAGRSCLRSMAITKRTRPELSSSGCSSVLCCRQTAPTVDSWSRRLRQKNKSIMKASSTMKTVIVARRFPHSSSAMVASTLLSLSKP